MFWKTLYDKVGKQPLTFSQHNHVFAELINPATGQKVKIFLDLKYDADGHPYFVSQEGSEEERVGGQNTDVMKGCDTGLADIEGNPIHEGDAIQYGDRPEYTAVVRYGEYNDYKPEFGFYLEWEKRILYRQNLLFWADKVKVMRSVYDS